MKPIFVFLFAFLIHGICCAQPKITDTLTRKYLVCISKNPFKRDLIIKEGNRVLIKDTANHAMKGKLKILNDSTVIVYNKYIGKSDTFNTKEIKKLRRPTVLSETGAYIAIIIGVPLIIAGGDLLIYSQNTLFGPLFGLISVSAGVTYTAGGIASYNGKRYHSRNYQYKIKTTKGYKLRLKYLWF